MNDKNVNELENTVKQLLRIIKEREPNINKSEIKKLIKLAVLGKSDENPKN